MVNTDEIQVGSCSLARRQYSIKRSVLFYNLRQFKQSQRQGGPGRQKGEGRGTPVGVSRGTGGEHVGPTPAGFPRPVPAVILDNLGRAVAILQRVLVELSATHRERSLSGPLLTHFPRQTQSSIRNRAGLGVTSGEIADQSAVQGCGFDSGTRETRTPLRFSFSASKDCSISVLLPWSIKSMVDFLPSSIV